MKTRVLLTLFLVGHTSRADAPLATVDGQPVGMDEVREMALRNGHNPATPAGFNAALKDAVNFELVAAEATRRGLADDPAIRKALKSLLVNKLLAAPQEHDKDDKAAIAPPAVTDGEVQAAYEASKPEFTQPSLVKGQVLFVLKEKGKEDAFTTKLKAVKSALDAKKPFGSVVAEFSDNPAAKANGGQTGWIVSGKDQKQYPAEVIAALFAAKDTTTTAGPITAGQGAWFLILNEKRDGRVLTLPEVQHSLRDRLFREKYQQRHQAFIDSIASHAKVERNAEAISAAQKTASDEAGGPPAGPVGIGTRSK